MGAEQIHISVSNGLIQNVVKSEDSIKVFVFDYDTDGIERKKLSCDENGKLCLVTEY